MINISKIYIVLKDDLQIDIKANIQANACSHHGDNFFFESLDPQVYFENVHFESLSIKKFIIELQYCHVGKDALQTCIYQIIDDKNNIIETKEKIIEKLNINIKDKDKTIENIKDELSNIYLSKSWKITKPLRYLMKKLDKGN